MTTREEPNPEEDVQALPRGAKLVRIANSFHRVVWSLGDGLGWAWYDIDGPTAKKIYGDVITPDKVDFMVPSRAAFDSQFHNPTYWGNIAEVSLKADTPWDDLKDKVYNQFGFVPGLDNTEIRRLLMQAFFEGWTENQWTVEYRQTGYYNNLNDTQRQWSSLSEAEKDRRTREQAQSMTDLYRQYMGAEISPDQLSAQARRIVSGAFTMEAWTHKIRQQALDIEGSPIWRESRAEQEAARAEGNEIENLTLAAENAWREWVGPGGMPSNFANRWGQDLASGKASEADLENYLKEISQARWSYKPPNTRWSDWAAAYKSQIKDELEVVDVEDSDPLLKKILNTDLTGQDLTSFIRKDERFLSTQKMYGQLSSAVADVGRRFGFIT